jgi:hypothetical protein
MALKVYDGSPVFDVTSMISDGMYGYKFVVGINDAAKAPFLVMAELWIPEGVGIVVTPGKRFRSERAEVTKLKPYFNNIYKEPDAFDWDGTASSLFEWSLFVNGYERRFQTIYNEGGVVSADLLDESETDCSNGIHYFKHMNDAESYLRGCIWIGAVMDRITPDNIESARPFNSN